MAVRTPPVSATTSGREWILGSSNSIYSIPGQLLERHHAFLDSTPYVPAYLHCTARQPQTSKRVSRLRHEAW
ncbi:hypothetical protein FJTKL_03903 [Diaporthe vaccinii]|uniref:Uncharacterized protein n=1 Tax=Diaporthe vaccinii TaxID=105482 RepID=A0ABR4F1G6_9PEZI